MYIRGLTIKLTNLVHTYNPDIAINQFSFYIFLLVQYLTFFMTMEAFVHVATQSSYLT